MRTRQQSARARRHRWPTRIATVSALAVLGLAGCGTSASPAPTQGSFPGFVTQSNTTCVQPSASPQDVALPATGGVSGTISFDAYPAGAVGCDKVRIATGDAVEMPTAAHGSAAGILLAASVTTPAPKPILTISVGEGLDGQPIFGVTTIVTGMKLVTSPDLNFPDGTYYATITSSSGKQSSLLSAIEFTAKNGVLTVAPLTLPNGKAFPVIITANTSSIIALYPRGVIPPPPADSPAPPASAPTTSAVPTAAVSQAPLVTNQPAPGAIGNPPPVVGSQMGTYSYDWTNCTGNPGCSASGKPLEQQSMGGTLQVPAGMWGTVSFEADIGYMGIYPPITNTCPSDWTVSAQLSGSGTISIPQNDPLAVPPNNAQCTITFSTMPPGGGTYYTEDIVLFPISIGATSN